MTSIVTTVHPSTTVDTLFTQAAEGLVKFHSERANGTTRRIQFLAEGTQARDTAEWVVGQRSEGRTMKAIASEMHVSVPTVRRMINALTLTWDVEEDAEEMLSGAIVVEGPERPDSTF